MTRTDCHAPSTFDPAAYSYLGGIYQGPEADGWDNDREVLDAIAGSTYHGNYEAKGSCDHCGAHFHYGAVFEHVNGDVIVVGYICADEAFGHATRREYDLARMKKSVELARERGRKAAAVAAFLEKHEGLADALQCDHYIVADINSKLIRYGDLSDRQVALVMKIAREQAERAQREAAREEEPKVAVVAGRREMTATVLGTRCQDSMYGIQFKMLVRTDDGQKLWSTIPASLMDLGAIADLRGKTIRFTGTVEVSRDDDFFGFVKRPTKASVIEAVAVAA